MTVQETQQISTVSAAPPNYQTQFKKDVLWKPLLRLFRRYLKKNALSKEKYQTIRDKPIYNQGKLFAQALDIPSELAESERTHMAVLLMINSHKVVLKKQLIPACRAIMEPHM